MKISQRELELFEELRHWGTALDPMVLRKARAARRGLEITQSGNYGENIVYAQASGGVAIMLSVDIENVSDRVIRIDAIRLRMPWYDGDFHWLKKLSSKEVRERGGYVLSACGPFWFDSAVVLNHRFRRDFRLYPGDCIDGFLFGEGTSSVPDDYPDRTKIPMQLAVFAGRGESYGAWVNLQVSREEQPRNRKSASKQVQPRTVRTEKRGRLFAEVES